MLALETKVKPSILEEAPLLNNNLSKNSLFFPNLEHPKNNKNYNPMVGDSYWEFATILAITGLTTHYSDLPLISVLLLAGAGTIYLSNIHYHYKNKKQLTDNHI